jgi:hypothetical protein
LTQDLNELDRQLNGNSAKREVGEKNDPTIGTRYYIASSGISTTYGPTPMHRESLEMAKQEYTGIRDQLETIRDERIPALEQLLIDAGAPWMDGQAIPE